MSSIAIGPGDRMAGALFAGRSVVWGSRGAAATAHPLATLVAIDLLRAGGSAVDAAIGANACLGLMEPTACGVGGDVFALLWDPAGREMVGLNGSGRSPRALTLQIQRERSVGGRIWRQGAVSVSVPGCVDGWWRLHQRFGRLPWARLFDEAIALCEAGAPIPQTIAALWQANVEGWRRDPETRVEELVNMERTFAPAGRRRPRGLLRGRDRRGHRRLLPAHRRLDDARGPEGPPRRVDPAAQRRLPRGRGVGAGSQHPGRDHPADAEHARAIRPRGHGIPVRGRPAPSGRGQATGVRRPRPLLRRSRLRRDPARMAAVEGLCGRAGRPHPAGPARPGCRPGQGARTRRHHLSLHRRRGRHDGVADPVKLPRHGLGAGPVRPGLHVPEPRRAVLARRWPPQPLRAGQRPFHTIIPGFATRAGEPWLAFGVMGGDMQPQGQVQVVTSLVDHGLGLQEAGDAPRWRHEGSSEPVGGKAAGAGVLHLETGVPAAARAGLQRIGWRIGPSDGGFGGYQAIERHGEVYGAASEMRKDGLALAY